MLLLFLYGKFENDIVKMFCKSNIFTQQIVKKSNNILSILQKWPYQTHTWKGHSEAYVYFLIRWMCVIRSLVWKRSVSLKSNFWLIRYTQDRSIEKIFKSYGFILVISRGELAEIKGVFKIMHSLSLSKVLRIYVKPFWLRNTIRKVKIYWKISHGWVDNDTSPCAFS